MQGKSNYHLLGMIFRLGEWNHMDCIFVGQAIMVLNPFDCFSCEGVCIKLALGSVIYKSSYFAL